MTSLVEAERTTVDGLAVFHADGPPPFTATLVTRCGVSDETATSHGLTHLVEHLALASRPLASLDCNGLVDNLFTVIWATGQPDQALAFVRDAADRIAALPVDRLDTERSILLAERASTGIGALAQAISLRYGPRGPGLVGYPEWGLGSITADEVTAWARSRFTRRSSALWLTGPVPDGLELALGAGEPYPTPQPIEIGYLAFPLAYAAAEPGGVVVTSVLPRAPASTAAMSIISRRLQDRLRYELGASYGVQTEYIPLSTDEAHVSFAWDATPQQVRRTAQEAVDIIRELGQDGATDSELEENLAAVVESFGPAIGTTTALHFAASQHVLGAEPETTAAILAEHESLTSAVIARVATDLLARLLISGPAELPALDGIGEYPVTSPERAGDGRRFRPPGLRGRRAEQRLVIGDDGVTLDLDEAHFLSMRWDACVACLEQPDGSKMLVTEDGFFIVVSREHWHHGDDAIAEIERRVASALVVEADAEGSERARQLDDLRGTLGRTWLVSEEIDVLPYFLDADEKPLLVAKASKGWRVGLLALTDRRLVFLYGDGTSHTTIDERVSITAAIGEGSKLSVTTPDGTVTYTDVGPKGRAEELATALGGS